MKILAIRGRNLASLRGDFELDLSAEPFASAGLFAITGPTGSGKSTLLDTLCLALFDRTPRLGGISRVQVGRADEDDRLGANDVRGLLTRGTGSGFAEVDFRGLDGRRWRARWEVRRARERADGRLQPQAMSLESLDGGDLVGGNKTEVLQAISERVGLSFDQFRRSVLLAQGDFAAFLHASSAERAELLEKITGTEIYARVSKAVYERQKLEKEALDALETRREALGVLGAEERTTLEREHAEAAARVEAAKKALEVAESDRRWFETLAQLLGREEEGERALAEAERAWEEAGERHQALEEIRAAQPLRPLLERCDMAESRRDEAREQVASAGDALEAAREQLAAAESALADARQAQAEAKEEHKAKEPELEKAALLDDRLSTAKEQAENVRQAADSARKSAVQAETEAEQARQEVEGAEAELTAAETWLEANPEAQILHGAWKPIESTLRDYAHAAETAEEARRALPTLVETEEKARQAAERTAEKTETARQVLEARQQEVEQAEAAIPEGRREQLETERELATERREMVREAEETLATIERLEREREAAETAARQARERAETAHGDAAKTRAALDQSTIRLDEARRALAASQAILDLESRRAELVEGEPCPLCGSTHHPYGHDGTPSPELEERKQRVAELEDESQKLTARRAAAEEKAENAAAEVEQQTGVAERLAGQLVAPRAAWVELREALLEKDSVELALPESPLDEETIPALERAIAGVEHALEELTRQERELGALERRAKESREARDTARRTFDEIKTEHEQAAETARQATDALAAGQRRRGDAETRLAQLVESLAGSLPESPDWRPGWRDELAGDPEAFLAVCRAEADDHERHTSARLQASAALDSLRPRAAEAGEKARAARRVAEEKQAELDKSLARVETLEGERAGVLEGRPVDEVRRALDEAGRQAEQALDAASKAEQEARGAFKVAETRLDSARVQLRKESAVFEEAEATLGEALSEHEIELATLRGRLEHDAAWCEREAEAIEALRQDRRDAEKILGERREVRSEHEKAGRPEASEEEAAEQLEQATAEHRVAEEEARELQVALRKDDDARAVGEALATEIAEQEARTKLWGRLSEVVGSADGARFRKFAQGLTLDSLLGHANAHLRDLAPRYHLQRIPGEDLELQVIDLDMGDEVRSINSLSGGETFLTSLALALALSSLSASETPVESLFIDEGFGTLDPQSLEVALSAFDALQATGRQIGIISHVRDLDERIGIKLEVVKLGAGRSRLEFAVGT